MSGGYIRGKLSKKNGNVVALRVLEDSFVMRIKKSHSFVKRRSRVEQPEIRLGKWPPTYRATRQAQHKLKAMFSARN